MNWTVLVAYCITGDLLKTPGHQHDPTLWVLAALAFAGKHKHARACAQEQTLFGCIPSCSRFSPRLHSLAHWIALLMPWAKLYGSSDPRWSTTSSTPYPR